MGTVDAISSVLPIHSSFSNSQYDIIELKRPANRYGLEIATLETIVEALVGIRRAPNLNPKKSLENSFQLECHKFSIKTLMKLENRGLLASILEVLEWLDKNKEFIFAGRSLESWSTLVSESVPVWKGSWLRGELMRPRASLPSKRTYDDHTLALRQVLTKGLEKTQTECTDNLVKNLSSLELDEAEHEGHAELTRKVPRLELEGDEVDKRPRAFVVSAEKFRKINADRSLSSQRVFNRLVRVRRNTAAALNTRFPVVAALHNAPKSSSITENELEKIELTVKAMLDNRVRYRRIITTSAWRIPKSAETTRFASSVTESHLLFSERSLSSPMNLRESLRGKENPPQGKLSPPARTTHLRNIVSLGKLILLV